MEIKITLANDRYTAIANAEVVKTTKWDDTMFTAGISCFGIV